MPAAKRGLPILGLFRGMQLAAVAPEEMSIAITPAIRKLMKHHALAMEEVDLWELHEAYAVTTRYNQRELQTPWETTNVNGGAVALGHPYGMSGIRYVGSTLMELAGAGRRKPLWASAPPDAWRRRRNWSDSFVHMPCPRRRYERSSARCGHNLQLWKRIGVAQARSP